MKKIISIILILVSSINLTSAQECWDKPNTITSDWRNYPGAGGNDLSINEWDWTLPGLVHPYYENNLQTSPTTYIELPYFLAKLAALVVVVMIILFAMRW
jgi:hypothetical protein